MTELQQDSHYQKKKKKKSPAVIIYAFICIYDIQIDQSLHIWYHQYHTPSSALYWPQFFKATIEWEAEFKE